MSKGRQTCTERADSRTPYRGYNSVGRVSALQAECRRFESDYLHQPSPSYGSAGHRLRLKHFTLPKLFERRRVRSLTTGSWKLKENCNSYTRSAGSDPRHKARNFSLRQKKVIELSKRASSDRPVRAERTKEANTLLLSVYGRTTDALASGGYEGRGRLR